MTTAQIILNIIATATTTTVTTKAAKALAAALIEAGEDADASEVVSWVIDPVADSVRWALADVKFWNRQAAIWRRLEKEVEGK